MSFDTIAAKKIINALRAHSRQPGGEIMERAAQLLDTALSDASNSMGQIRNAEAAAIDSQNKLTAALLDLKTARDKLPLLENALATVRAIAAAKRGGNKMAVDWLAANGLNEPEVKV